MSLFDKKKMFQENSIKNFQAEEFIEIFKNESTNINSYFDWSSIDLITSKKFGQNFLDLWEKMESILEKIELIIYVNSKEWINNNYRNYNLKSKILKSNRFEIFFNKLNFYIQSSPYKLIEIDDEGEIVSKLVKKEVGEILEVIGDNDINLSVHKIMNASKHKDAETEFFSLQKPYYRDFKNFTKKGYKHSSLNFKTLNRKIQTFVRHDKESTDCQLRKYYQSLNSLEKLIEIKNLTVEFLIAVHLIKSNK